MTSGPDPEILELFRSELDTHLPVLNSGLMALEKGEVNDAQIEGMMRAAHSIKGAARIVGIDPAVRVAHTLEDCFTAAKSKKIVLSSDSVDVLLAGVDALQQICMPAENGGTVEIDSLLERIGDVGAGKRSSPPKAAVVATSRAATPPRGEQAEEIILPALVDDAAAQALRQQWLEHIEGAPPRVCFDFSMVREIGALGMMVLVAIVREATQGSQTKIEFRGAEPPVQKLWRVMGLESLVANES